MSTSGSVTQTDEAEVTGKQVAVMHTTVESGAPTRTVLVLVSQDDLGLEIEDDDVDFTPAVEYTTRRYAAAGTITGSVTTAIATDLSALSLIGLADSNGQLIKSGTERKIGFDETTEEYIEIAFFPYQPDFSTVDVEADSELLNRLDKVKIQNPEFDYSEAPMKVSFEMWIEGTVFIDFSSA